MDMAGRGLHKLKKLKFDLTNCDIGFNLIIQIGYWVICNILIRIKL